MFLLFSHSGNFFNFSWNQFRRAFSSKSGDDFGIGTKSSSSSEDESSEISSSDDAKSSESISSFSTIYSSICPKPSLSNSFLTYHHYHLVFSILKISFAFFHQIFYETNNC